MNFKNNFKFRLKMNFIFLIVTIFFNRLAESAKHVTDSICLDDANVLPKILSCEHKNEGIFISEVEYTNDYMNKCESKNQQEILNSLRNKNRRGNVPVNKCSAYPTQLLADFCNGKQNCTIKLLQPTFNYSFHGSNCDFKAKILKLSYDCVPINFDDASIAKYDICTTKQIDRPIHGFIHSPNYPRNYDASKFCQLTIKLKEDMERLEIFLIDMELEALSKRTANPTDYLQINNKEQHFGEKRYITLYNDTKDAVIVFKSDVFFSKKGFFVYFKTVTKINEIELEESDLDFIESEISTSTIITSTPSTTPPVLDILNNSLILDSTTNNSRILRDNKLNVNDIVSTSRLKSDKSVKLSEKEDGSSFISQHTSKAIITLMILTFILSSIIIFLVFKNRRRFLSESMIYKTAIPIEALGRYNDESVVTGYLETSSVLGSSLILNRVNINGTTVGYINPVVANANKFIKSKGNAGKRVSDDSMAHLLMSSTNSPSSFAESMSSSAKLKKTTSKKRLTYPTNEVYEDINHVSEQYEEVNPKTINALLERNQNLISTARQNDYSFAPATIITGEANVENKLGYPIEISTNNLANDMPRTSRLSVSNISPTPSTSNPIVTSTPCLPKTQPPELSKNMNDYDVPDRNRMSAQNEYQACSESSDSKGERKESTITNEAGNEYDCDYQIPLNTPKSAEK